MGLGDLDLIDDGDGGGGKATSMVSCSICLDIVTNNGDRSWAKLQCGHHFHLDCIGSAFNVKGVMQCPNCRNIEKGQWLYSNGSRPYAEFNMEDWGHDEDLYDLSYSEMSFGVHWCPFSGLTQLPSSFDEGEFPPAAYHDLLLGQHAVLAEHAAVSSASHPCPYVAYFGPFPPSSSNSSGGVSDGSNFSSHWNNQSAPSEIPTSYAFPSMDVHYHSWEHHSSLFPTARSRVAALDQSSIPSMSQRASMNNSDIPRSGSFVPSSAVGHGSNARAGSSVAASMLPPYPGSVARARERAQALQAYSQQTPGSLQGLRTPVIPASRRSNGHRNMAQGGQVASSSEQANGFYFYPSTSSTARNYSEAENSIPNRFHGWEREQFPSLPLSQAERDPIWGPNHQLAGGSDTTIRPTGYRQRHGSESRMPSLHRS